MKGELKGYLIFSDCPPHPQLESHEGRIERCDLSLGALKFSWPQFLESHEGRIESEEW